MRDPFQHGIWSGGSPPCRDRSQDRTGVGLQPGGQRHTKGLGAGLGRGKVGDNLLKDREIPNHI